MNTVAMTDVLYNMTRLFPRPRPPRPPHIHSLDFSRRSSSFQFILPLIRQRLLKSIIFVVVTYPKKKKKARDGSIN